MKKKLVLIALVLAAAVVGCKDEESVSDKGNSTGNLSDTDKERLYDKVWYPTSAAGGVNFEFKTDGVFRINKSLDGTWSWQNDGDTMNVVDHNNARYNMLFEEINASTIKFRSSQAGDNYQTLFEMKDTE
jgi:hypothetical protein